MTLADKIRAQARVKAVEQSPPPGAAQRCKVALDTYFFGGTPCKSDAFWFYGFATLSLATLILLGTVNVLLLGGDM